jgi:hypothetical protein
MALIVVEEKNILTILSARTVNLCIAIVDVRFLLSDFCRRVLSVMFTCSPSLLYLFAAVLSTMNMCFGRRIYIYHRQVPSCIHDQV